ncbi:MAG: hypothetical protein RMM28_11085 [Thermoleophilia bacterium]|nr:hypothetical protein [Gaiellaceae bacterium]MDW8339670.1 hypothetical protein [Thermoleophilia bacterium]
MRGLLALALRPRLLLVALASVLASAVAVWVAAVRAAPGVRRRKAEARAARRRRVRY